MGKVERKFVSILSAENFTAKIRGGDMVKYKRGQPQNTKGTAKALGVAVALIVVVYVGVSFGVRQ